MKFELDGSIIYNSDCLEILKTLPDNSIDSLVTDPPYGISFMGKKWDYDIPTVELWKEVLRVLKPGAHGLVACGTRTQHRMAVNLEDAGFEIRDIVTWMYGSGFPKSLNIGKAIDKIQGNEREFIKNEKMGISSKNSNEGYKRPSHLKPTYILTRGTSEYEGWGTALKPAQELFTLIRKPLSEKSIAENVLRWGTGAINIDGCRVGTDEKMSYSSSQKQGVIQFKTGTTEQNNLGRFPANIILSYNESDYQLKENITNEEKREVFRWLSENA